MLGLIVGFPLFGFLVNGIWYLVFQSSPSAKKANSVVTGLISTLAISVSFAMSLWLFYKFSLVSESSRVIEQKIFSWIQFSGLQVDFILRLDALSLVFCLVVSGVGALIHLYSIGYMAHDKTPGKFFAYLNLFCFAMLVLVLGGSLPVLFLGWEGVGLCSYLLIGYWYEDYEKAIAGKKAFVVNRIGDFGFLLGMFLIFTSFGTLDFESLRLSVIQGNAPSLPHLIESGTVTAICLLLFLGCTGKSAQIPLYVWLPDAMAGPTPVSALIHAATMVTSGIYLVARMNFLFSLSPMAMQIVAVTGGLTAVFAGTIAVAQTDIKKILAYSTVSQLGYMFLGCGVGAFSAGVFHVVTHAFFKALLFLGAGSVIHGMHEEQNILKMGNLRKHMPKTYLVFFVAWLAICGIPPFSGFFSKDEILWKTFSSHGGSVWLWVLGVLGAVLTAFYMTRLFVLTFLGDYRGSNDHKIHDSPSVMIIPLQILAVFSLIGGLIGIPHFNWIEHWLLSVIPHHEIEDLSSHSLEWILMGVSVLVAVVGIAFAFRFYRNLNRANELKQKFSRLHKIIQHKWFIDEIYEFLLVKPIHAFSKNLWLEMDVSIVDRLMVGFGKFSQWSGQGLRVLHTGVVQVYLIFILLGVFLALGYLIYGMV
ncbi:MAG: NADH-quinone oxidoreductase subunit L [Bdellovibrio sp.]|nr:NADH-quinone oxidoreductase subunit L [Bdellovibrio sp.]